MAASAFIGDVQNKLEPDLKEKAHTFLQIVASVSSGGVLAGTDTAFPQWNVPGSTIVHARTILYPSFAAPLFAVFVVMLGGQWLNRHDQAKTRRSVIDRGWRRQREMNGMITWDLDLIMQIPALTPPLRRLRVDGPPPSSLHTMLGWGISSSAVPVTGELILSGYSF